MNGKGRPEAAPAHRTGELTVRSGQRVHVSFDAHGEVDEYRLAPGRPRRRAPHPEDDLGLRALAALAWEARGGPGSRAAVEAIVNWHDRRHVRAWERRQRERAALVMLLRETAPARPARREAA